ncbi:DUF2231 domain-containing protein [Aestuariimicrobium soli]|uniref:DUF2231 domain-containing protein n=1 Tax=Aestuariimicrobium soli TaxID=2035834 RepID=UPI003EBC29D9
MNIGGLPLHPLVVHLAVVLVPLAALGALLVVWRRGWRDRYGWLATLVAIGGAAGALAARFTGPALADETGIGASPRFASHEQWGLWAPWPALVLAVTLVVLLWADRSSSRSGLGLACRVVAAVAAVVSLVLVVLAGHSGATLVWGR